MHSTTYDCDRFQSSGQFVHTDNVQPLWLPKARWMCTDLELASDECFLNFRGRGLC